MSSYDEAKQRRSDLDEARANWSDAANRRLQGMRSGSFNPLPSINETAQDLLLRRQEGLQSGEPGAALINQAEGENYTKARLLDWEAAAKQANDPNAPMPIIDTNAKLSRQVQGPPKDFSD